MATAKKPDDPHKTYNEQLKTFETLAKREAELLQKLAQADPEKDIEAKQDWAAELAALLDATARLKAKRIELLNDLGK